HGRRFCGNAERGGSAGLHRFCHAPRKPRQVEGCGSRTRGSLIAPKREEEKPMLKTIAASAAFLVLASAANAAQMKLLVGGSMQEPFKEVGADFAKKNGHAIEYIVDTTGALQKRLRSGEKADIILVSEPGMDALEKEHLIMPGTRVNLANAAIGV